MSGNRSTKGGAYRLLVYAVIVTIVCVNLALSLYMSYRLPTTRFSDYPAWWTLFSAVATLFVVAWTAMKGRGRS